MASLLCERKTKLTLITNATARYRGRERSVIVEVQPETATLRLSGTRTRYEVSWRGVFDWSAKVAAEKARAERKARRKATRENRTR